jgi:hypothetical protein
MFVCQLNDILNVFSGNWVNNKIDVSLKVAFAKSKYFLKCVAMRMHNSLPLEKGTSG